MPQKKIAKRNVVPQLERKSNEQEDHIIEKGLVPVGKKSKKRKLEQGLLDDESNDERVRTKVVAENPRDETSEPAEKPPATKKERKPRTKGNTTLESTPVSATAGDEVNDSKTKKKKFKKKKKKNQPEVIPKDQDSMREKCTSYLEEWKENRSEWKFQKLIQVWLIQNMLDDSRVTDDVFPLFLEYIGGAQGNTVKTINEKAFKVMEEAEKADADLDDPKLQRARSIIQALVSD